MYFCVVIIILQVFLIKLKQREVKIVFEIYVKTVLKLVYDIIMININKYIEIVKNLPTNWVFLNLSFANCKIKLL